MIYEVAGLTFEMTPQFPRLAEQAKNYCADGIPAFQVAANPREWQAILRQKEKEAETARMQEYAEYICCSADFCRKLPEHGRFYLHASAVVLDGRGYLFSAPSGTGKSTHTSLWLREFPGSFILNDDKPVIWPQKDGITVWGSPFSGKTNLQVNQGVPLQGICFLKRGKQDTIRRLCEEEALAALLDNTYRPPGTEPMNRLLDMLEMVIRRTGMFELECTPNTGAARLSREEMSRHPDRKDKKESRCCHAGFQ